MLIAFTDVDGCLNCTLFGVLFVVLWCVVCCVLRCLWFVACLCSGVAC